MTSEPTQQTEEQWRAGRKAAAAEHAKTPWKIVGDIMRFERGGENPGGQYTLVSQEQMLIEILHAMGNAGTWDEPSPVTVSYAPGETEEERQQFIAALRKNKSLSTMADDYPRRPGHHSVSLWDCEYKYDETHDTYMWDNDIRVTFMFKTDPDVDFWNGQ